METKTYLHDAIADEAMRWLGSKATRYSTPNRGRDGENGFDCSGLLYRVLETAYGYMGLTLPDDIRHTNEFLDSFGKQISHGLQRRGDLVIFPDDKGTFPKHSGIMISKIDFVEARPEIIKKVILSPLEIKPLVEIAEDASYNVTPSAFKRAIVPFGKRWKLDTVFIEDVTEINSMIPICRVNTEDLSELRNLLYSLKEGNALRENLTYFVDVLVRRQFATQTVASA